MRSSKKKVKEKIPPKFGFGLRTLTDHARCRHDCGFDSGYDCEISGYGRNEAPAAVAASDRARSAPSRCRQTR